MKKKVMINIDEKIHQKAVKNAEEIERISFSRLVERLLFKHLKDSK